jgi:putative membrane protein
VDIDTPIITKHQFIALRYLLEKSFEQLLSQLLTQKTTFASKPSNLQAQGEKPMLLATGLRGSKEWLALKLLWGINLVSLFGFSVFTLNPELLTRWPWTAPIFARSYPIFAQLQIATAFIALSIALSKASGFRWILPFLGVCAISFTSEYGGTAYGIPFGHYEYTDLLGPKIAEKVPFLIPLSWFFMAIPSLAISRKIFAEPTARVQRITLGAALLIVWDLALDPAMSFLTPFWVWENPGFYYGAPLLNLVGWFLTGVAIFSWLEWVNVWRWVEKVNFRFLLALYGANLFLPLGMLIAAQVWPAAALTILALGLTGWALRARSGVALPQTPPLLARTRYRLEPSFERKSS